MVGLPESLNRARAAAFADPNIESAAGRMSHQRPTPYRTTTAPRPQARTMRPPEARANDPRLAWDEQSRALAELQRNRDMGRTALEGQAQAVVDPEHTPLENGVLGVARAYGPGAAYDAVRAGARVANGDRGALGDLALNTGIAALPFLGVHSARGEPAPVPMREAPVPQEAWGEFGDRTPQWVDAYRGMKQPFRDDWQARAEWWADNPRDANTYARSLNGGNVMPGRIDTSSFLDVDAGGAPYTGIPIEGIDASFLHGPASLDGRYQTAETNRIARVARENGYDGVRFSNVRDDSEGLGEPGTVYAVTNPASRQFRFEQPSEPPAEAPRPVAPDAGSAGRSARRLTIDYAVPAGAAQADVIKNPTPADLARLSRGPRVPPPWLADFDAPTLSALYRDLRTIRDVEGNLYAVNGGLVEHRMLRSGLERLGVHFDDGPALIGRYNRQGEQFVLAPEQRGGTDMLGRAPVAPDGGGAGAFTHEPHRGGGRIARTDGAGGLDYVDNGDGLWSIRGVEIDPSLRNQKQGVALYEELIRQARAAGVQRIMSDGMVTREAQHVWDALYRRGYPVEYNGGHTFTLDLARTPPARGGAPPPTDPKSLPRRKPPSGGFFNGALSP